MVLYDLTNATDIGLKALIEGEYDDEMLFTAADEVRRRYYGDEVFLRALRMIAILRLMFPYTLIPATTALGTIDGTGREKGLKAGANVVMPNLSPVRVRKQYDLYDNKICTGEGSAQCRGCLERRVNSAGYSIVNSRGDVKG